MMKAILLFCALLATTVAFPRDAVELKEGYGVISERDGDPFVDRSEGSEDVGANEEDKDDEDGSDDDRDRLLMLSGSEMKLVSDI